MRSDSFQMFRQHIFRRDPHQTEFLQAVDEVLDSLWPFISANPQYAQHALLERLIEPERIIQFRVCWIDDAARTRVNRAFRIQHNNALGPYKGGLRFHPSVNLSILKFLAFEQTFKNALTGLPMGSGKGGSDFDPKGKSDAEIMRFCQAFMLELHRHLGPDIDVPAGDIGVGGREIGYLAGMLKKLTNSSASVLTGKDPAYGGSLIRAEATGYGTLYFVKEMLHHVGRTMQGCRVAISGSGNVAQFAIEKAMEYGAQVVTVSDSTGTVYDPSGFDAEKLAVLRHRRNTQRQSVASYAQQFNLDYLPDRRPWHIPVDIALPCATQNELDRHDAEILIANGVTCIAEGANMPCTNDAVLAFLAAGVLYAPGKASNAGGVAVSGLEMSQNAIRLSWTREEVDSRLQDIMARIHTACVEYGTTDNDSINYVDGANIAGFVRVADAMLAQGVV